MPRIAVLLSAFLVIACLEGPAGPAGPQGEPGPSVVVLSGFLTDANLSGTGQVWVIPIPASTEPPVVSIYLRSGATTVWKGLVEGAWSVAGESLWINETVPSRVGSEYRIVLAQL